MAEVLEQMQIDAEFQQKQFMLMGLGINNQKKKISPEEIKQMQKDYTKMYFAFTSINWGQGKTLGMAWQKSLEQMDSFVKTKMKKQNHPLNEDLMKFHTEFKRDTAKSIMTDSRAEEKLNEKLKQRFLDNGTKSFAEAKAGLDNVYQKYEPAPEKDVAKQPKNVQFQLATHRAQQMLLLMQQRMNQRGAA